MKRGRKAETAAKWLSRSGLAVSIGLALAYGLRDRFRDALGSGGLLDGAEPRRPEGPPVGDKEDDLGDDLPA